MATSYWLDQRDIPDGRYGKIRTPGCECERGLTCKACLDRAHTRNMAEREASPFTRRACNKEVHRE
jgi:hypothetical protein